MSTAARNAHISRAASLFYSALKKQRTGFIKRATSKLKALYEASSPEVPRILATIPPIALKPTIRKLLMNAGTSGASQTNAMMGVSAISQTPQRVKDYIAEHSLEQIGADLDETTVAEIKTILEAGLEAQTPFSKIITEIKQAGAFSRARAQTIAVTEVGNAYSQGLLGQAKDLVDQGLDMEKSWLAEDEPCDICAGNADEGWIDVDADFSSGDDAPLAHPNCFPSGVLVSGGGVRAATARAYHGELLHISTPGNDELSITPNHPILSMRGWIPAKDLEVGDYLFQCRDERAAVALIDPDDHHIKTRIEQMPDALTMAGAMSAVSVPTTAIAFHGDAGRDDEVDIVTAARLLPNDLKAALTEDFEDELFRIIESWRIILASPGGLGSFLIGDDAPADSLMRSGSDPLSVGIASIGEAEALRSETVALLESGRCEPAVDSPAVTTEPSSHRKNALARLMSPVKINSIRQSKFSGQVYNLETEAGFYFANSIVVHNCLCALLVRRVGAVD